MMTAKDFNAIASIFNKYAQKTTKMNKCNIEADGFKLISRVTEDLIDYFKTTNAKFDKDKFLKACGVEE